MFVLLDKPHFLSLPQKGGIQGNDVISDIGNAVVRTGETILGITLVVRVATPVIVPTVARAGDPTADVISIQD